MRLIKFKIWIGVIVSLSLLLWLALTLDWKLVAEHLATSNFFYLLPLTILLIAQSYLRSWRWKFFLPANSNVQFSVLFDSLMLGNFANFVLPLRAGEFIRPWLLSTKSKINFAEAFASIIIERFFDLFLVLLCFGGLLTQLTGMPIWVNHGALALLVMAVFIFIGVLVALVAPNFVIKLMSIVLKPLPGLLKQKIFQFLEGFLRALCAVKNVRQMAMAFFFTVINWFIGFAFFWLALPMLHLPASFMLAVTSGVIVALAVAAPSAPGFLGVYQTGCIVAFALFGFDKEQAFAFALITHVHQYIFYIGWGVYLMLKSGLTWQGLKSVGQ